MGSVIGLSGDKGVKLLNLLHSKSQQLSKQLKRQLFISFLAISLTTSIVLGSGLPIASQSTNQLTPRDDVIEDIKSAAERHVYNDSPLQTETILRAFEYNSVGLTSAEIIEIYETEYTKLKETKDTNFWEQATPQAGWIVAILIAVLAIFRDTLGKWITTAIETIFEGAYARLAGNRLLRGLALRRYRNALYKKHQKLEIPFRANRPLAMEDVYIPLQAKGINSNEQIDIYDALSRFKRLVVTGPPGGGKSILLKYIALAYGTDHLDLADRPIPVLIEFHRLGNPDLTQEELIQALVDAFNRDNFPRAGRFVQQSLKGSLMLLLDGLDEVKSDVRPIVVQQIKDLLDTYENCRAIITCRTAVYRDEFFSVTEQTLKVSEFSDQQIRRFLKAWEPEMPADKSVDQLLQTLRNRPRIVDLARNPLLLTIIAHLYSDPSFVLPHSRTEFYQKSTGILLEQWDQWRQTFNKHKALNKRRILKHLALFSQTQNAQGQQDRRRMDHYTVLEEIKGILPELSLDPEEHTESILNEIVERSGLLQIVDGGEGYKFSHLTLQEYFTAEALKNNADTLAARFRQAPDDWREVVKLWCGFEGNSTAFIEAIYEIDAITGFECLADAQEIEPTSAESILDAFKIRLGKTNQQDQITSAFGAVAADIRPRSRAVFQFLQHILDNSEEATRYQAAADALSKTSLPEAAKVLGTHYGRLSEVRTSLIRMGDLAVPVLSSLAPQQPTVLDDLFTIGTPDAAKALAYFLWEGPPTQQAQAAWYLASLLPQLGIEAALRSESITLEKTSGPFNRGGNNDSLDWIWQPFGEPADSSLPSTIGQIAKLMTEGPTETAPTPLPKLDPRLVVPLCTIHLQNQVELPKTWPNQADALLEQQTKTEAITQQTQKMIAFLLQDNPSDSRWQLLVSGLTPQLQLDLIHRLIAYSPPNRTHWRYIFHDVSYDFSTGLQYKCVLWIASGSSILAILGMAVAVFQQPDIALTVLVSLALLIVIIFWATLRRGIEKAFDPNTFLSLGPSGLLTFGIELRQLLQNNLVWTGIQPLYQAVASVFTFAVTFAGVFAGAGVFAIAVAIAVAGAGIFAGAGAVASTDDSASTVALAGAGTVAFVFAGSFALAGAGAGAFVFAGAGASTVAGTVAGYGLGSWYKLQSRPRQQFLFKILPILAFPWFCWLPVVFIFGSFYLHHLFSIRWLWVGLIDIFIFSVCRGLWWHGQQSEEKARNPLRRGILQSALEAIHSK